MFLLGIQLGVMEIVVFSFSCLLLGGTIYFFRKTLISLRAIKEVQRRNTNRMRNIYMQPEVVEQPKTSVKLFKHKNKQEPLPQVEKSFTRASVKNEAYDDETISAFKKSILNQKQQLDLLLRKVDGWKEQQEKVVEQKDADLWNKIERLEILLEEKDEELQSLKKQDGIAEQMAARMEQVQNEFDTLQERLGSLEKQAANANQLAMDLEDLKEEYKQVKTEQTRKQEKMQELMNENARLQKQLYETEDKLQNANTQRQQLLKKTKLLEELNTDFQTVSDTNSKLKNELRRIGELESMLNMMTEERDHLLGKRL